MTYEIKIPPKQSCPATPEEAEDGQVNIKLFYINIKPYIFSYLRTAT